MALPLAKAFTARSLGVMWNNYKAYNGGIRVRQEDVLAYLRGYGIEIEVYDKMYVDESGVTQYFIPKNIISCQSAGVYLGDYVFGRTPEERSGSFIVF